MSSDHAVIDGRTVTASAVVAAPPAEVFALIANPHRHHEFDGSGTVQAAVSGPERLGMGDRFGMKMKIKLPEQPCREGHRARRHAPGQREVHPRHPAPPAADLRHGLRRPETGWPDRARSARMIT
jgi:uncharacterized protein YndB with AHSA1/START domain